MDSTADPATHPANDPAAGALGTAPSPTSGGLDDTLALPTVRGTSPVSAWTSPRGGSVAAPVGGRAAARRAARKRAAERTDGMRQLLPRALVLAALAGGTSAFVAQDKAVRLTVDGRERTLHTFADDVTELLAEEGVEVDEHDIVAPEPGRGLSDGDEVAVRHARPMTLTLNGDRRQVWTTARTVSGALRELGVRADGAYLSVSRSTAIGRAGLTLDVRTERRVTFLADGRQHTVRTTAATVEEALREAGVELRGDDTTSVPLDRFPRDGQTVTVMRIRGDERAHLEHVPFRTVHRDDPRLAEGTRVIERRGRAGLRRITYQVRTVNGVRERERRVGAELVRAPRTQLVRVGTRRPSRAVARADRLDWPALARCESGGRPNAVDSSGTYGGLYQFDTRTWRSLGGRGSPQDASRHEQTLRAKKLYVLRGASPWPTCGHKLTR